MMPSSAARRLRALRNAMPVPAFLVTAPADIFYLTGFTGSNAAILVTEDAAHLYTDSRYTVQARQQVHGARVHISRTAPAIAALESLPDGFRGTLGLDAASITLGRRAHIAAAVRRRGAGVRLKPIESPVLGLRMLKDADELARMRRAALLGCRLYAGIGRHLVPGVTETSIAARLEFAARNAGAEKMSFDTIVAAAARGALPHGVASRATLPRNGLVVLDFGVILDGYCSDMTRTVQLGKPSAKQRDAYLAVLEAQQASIDAVRPGATCAEVDAAGRKVLQRAKLAKYFTHSTGHGVGIEIHEPPRIGAAETTELQPGMVITIEPGVYLPSQFGIRIEDMVAVTHRGAEVLTVSAPKGWAA